jgi:small subunit ribosomal protein S3
VGQKTNPKAFRLVTTEKHLSQWYTNKVTYPELIKEDFFIREKINEFCKKILTISKIEIDRVNQENTEICNQPKYTSIVIYSLFPRDKEISKKINKYFDETFQNLSPNHLLTSDDSKEDLKIYTAFLIKNTIRNLIRFFTLKTQKNYFITIKFIKNPFEDANLIAKYIAEQLESRVPFRRAIKTTIKKVQRTQIKGIKIQVSGRLNGIEIARSEWKKDGRIPLHTLSAKIDYTHQYAQTIYGIIGIKIWLFYGESN